MQISDFPPTNPKKSGGLFLKDLQRAAINFAKLNAIGSELFRRLMLKKQVGYNVQQIVKA